MKLFLIGVAAAVLLGLIVVLVAPFLIPGDVYKAQLAAIVKERTGRDLRIDGSVRFSILPRIGLIAEGVSLSSPPGGFSRDLLQTEKLTGGIKLAPLLHGVVEISDLSLANPKLAFEIDKEGRRNWVFHPPPKPPSTSAAPAASSGGVSVTAGTVNLSGGNATYVDQRGGKSYEASQIEMTVSMPSPSGPVDAQGSLTWNSEKMTIDASLASLGDVRDGGASPANLKITSAPLKLSFQGELTGGKPRRIAGTIDLSSPSARVLFASLGLRRPYPGELGPLSVNARLEVLGRKISITDAEIALSETGARGSLTFERSEHPTLSGDLEVSNLDLTPYLSSRPASSVSSARSEQNASMNAASGRPAVPPVAANPALPAQSPSAAGTPASAFPTPAAPPGWGEARFDLAPFRKLDAAVKLRASALRWGDLHLDNASIELRLNEGKLRIDAPQMALYGGTGTGALTVDSAAAMPAFAASADLHGVTVQPMLRDLADLGQLSGAGDIRLVLEGKGGGPNELVSSLAGNASIKLAHGVLSTAGLGEFMQGIAGPLGGRKTLPSTIEFDTLSATGTIADGVLRSKDLELSSPKMTVSGEGTVDLEQQRIDYVAVLSNPEIGARIAITGPWVDPSYKAQSVTISPNGLRRGGKLRDLLKELR